MLFVYRKFMPDLPRCTSVDFFEHLVEQFVVRETVSFDDFHDTVLCVADIMVNMNPVSYTHLDVYKRQIGSRITSGRTK